MKRKLSLFNLCILVACMLSCNNNKSSSDTTTSETVSVERPREIDSLHWLIGNWQNISPQGHFQENWKKINDTLFTGEGSLIAGNDTMFYETIRLEQRGTYLYYIAVVRGQNNNEPVSFRLTSYGNHQFIFQNPDHDYPQKITYIHGPGDSLFAEVSGMKDGKSAEEKIALGRQ